MLERQLQINGKNAYDNILDELSLSSYVQMDESMYSINGSRGYVWLATNKKATYVVVSSSRKATTLDQYFNTLLEIPVVVDGFVAYNKFKVRQRCWGSSTSHGRKACG